MSDRETFLTARLAERGEELERLRAAGLRLISAMDDMHAKGETFTGRVSIAASELRAALTYRA